VSAAANVCTEWREYPPTKWELFVNYVPYRLATNVKVSIAKYRLWLHKLSTVGALQTIGGSRSVSWRGPNGERGSASL
jgi:hypothetical protein